MPVVGKQKFIVSKQVTLDVTIEASSQAEAEKLAETNLFCYIGKVVFMDKTHSPWQPTRLEWDETGEETVNVKPSEE